VNFNYILIGIKTTVDVIIYLKIRFGTEQKCLHRCLLFWWWDT